MGSYAVITFTATTGADTADLLAEGYAISLTLDADGTTSGTLFIAEGGGLTLDLTGDGHSTPIPLRSGWIMVRIPSSGYETCSCERRRSHSTAGRSDLLRDGTQRALGTHLTDASTRHAPSLTVHEVLHRGASLVSFPAAGGRLHPASTARWPSGI